MYINCLFVIFIRHPGPYDQFLGPFRGSCCVEMTQNSSKSTFRAPFDLIMTENRFTCLSSYDICIVNCLFNVFFCHPDLCDSFFWATSGVLLCKNDPKWLKINISWTFIPCYDWKPCYD